ncbi:putative protein kinase RLK-Pelle-PERK-1 family [Helianthus anomalus]
MWDNVSLSIKGCLFINMSRIIRFIAIFIVKAGRLWTGRPELELLLVHEDCHPRIIHRDIKSSNILLDDNFDAQVSYTFQHDLTVVFGILRPVFLFYNFGLAKLSMDSNTHVTTRVMGTFVYMAPEYASSGKLTEKSDVFSFGVVVLELITGRKPVDASQPLGDESLVEWVGLIVCYLLVWVN